MERMVRKAWKIHIVFLKTENANISRAIRDLLILTVCSVIVRCMQGSNVRETQDILKRTEGGLRCVQIVRFRINRSIMRILLKF